MNFFSNMRIGRRLALGFGTAVTFVILVSCLGAWNFHGIAKINQQMMESPLVKERLISAWYRLITNNVTRATAISQSFDPTLTEAFAAETQAAKDESTALQNQIQALLVADDEIAIFNQLVKYRTDYNNVLDHMNALEQSGDIKQARLIFDNEFIPATERYQEAIHGLLNSQRNYMDFVANSVSETSKQSQTLLLSSALLVTLLCAFFSWRLTRGITQPLSEAVAAARLIAQGDLSGQITVNSTDETGELLSALSEMNQNLNRLVANVRNGANSIATASSQIAAGNTDLSSRTEEQAASLTETASAMEELTNTVRQTAENARQANQLANSTTAMAHRGGEATEQVTGTMDSISDSAAKIVNIISVIDGIAFQTNILALNAAVEAARAGEQGRGFAVVASEVRSLAQRSATAAHEIKDLIDDAVNKIQDGAKLVNDAGGTILDVVTSVEQVSNLINEISIASDEQSIGIEQVNRAVLQMDEVTRQNAALVEQAAAATFSLEDQTQHLTTAVQAFRVSQH